MTVVAIRSQKKAALWLISMAATVAVLIIAAGWFGGYRINTTPSYPLGLWRIGHLARDIRVGDRVFICPPDNDVFRSAKERGYLRTGLCPGGFGPLIKTVAATAGQRVETNEFVTIDDRPLAHSPIARLDGRRRSLSTPAGGVIPQDFVFLHSDFVGSYDSRYFGPVPKSGVLGLAEEVLTCAP
jgi:conjugative transfer signal peptidase TraF